MSLPEQGLEQERIRQNVQRTVGMRVLREIRKMMDEELHDKQARAKLLRVLLHYGWIVLLPATLLLLHYLGVI